MVEFPEQKTQEWTYSHHPGLTLSHTMQVYWDKFTDPNDFANRVARWAEFCKKNFGQGARDLNEKLIPDDQMWSFDHDWGTQIICYWFCFRKFNDAMLFRLFVE